MRRVLRVVQEQRDARYGLLRGFFHGADDDTVAELDHARLLSVTLSPGSGSINRTLGEQALPTRGVAVVSLRRASGAVLQPGDSLVLAAGDTLVLSGLPEQLALAEEALLTPGRGGGPGLAAEPR
jgi:CPA2 family monovalent cation:H+ antiporter-2